MNSFTKKELEKLVVHGKSPAVRMLALEKLKSKYYNESVANKLSDIEKILNTE